MWELVRQRTFIQFYSGFHWKSIHYVSMFNLFISEFICQNVQKNFITCVILQSLIINFILILFLLARIIKYDDSFLLLLYFIMFRIFKLIIHKYRKILDFGKLSCDIFTFWHKFGFPVSSSCKRTEFLKKQTNYKLSLTMISCAKIVFISDVYIFYTDLQIIKDLSYHLIDRWWILFD